MSAVTFDSTSRDWIFQFEDIALQTANAWRVIADGRIVVGWRDEGQVFGLQEPFDARARVREHASTAPVSMAWTDGPGDLHVRFGDTITLDVFNDSIGYEGWQLLGPGDRHVMALGGGGVHESETIE